MVDEVFLSIDKDKSVSASLEAIKPDIFANGGDRDASNSLELDFFSKNKINIYIRAHNFIYLCEFNKNQVLLHIVK